MIKTSNFIPKILLLFLVIAVSLLVSCSQKTVDPLVLYFQRIEKLKVNDSVLSYNQKKAEKQVQLLRIRAREFNFPYEKNGVLQIIEDTRTRDTGQEKFLIILLTKNKKLGIRRIDYKLRDTKYKKQSFQKILETADWRSLQTNCSFVADKKCKIYREWITVTMTPELSAILKKVDKHTIYRLYGKTSYYDFDARYDWLPSKDAPLKDKRQKEKEKNLDDFLKGFSN